MQGLIDTTTAKAAGGLRGVAGGIAGVGRDLVQETSPATGSTTYTYDAAGNRTSRTDARGVVVHSTYDPLN
ncbi:MAG: RHS repeat domain-containing protein, partial [Gammaproteobacteria bacterium]